MNDKFLSSFNPWLARKSRLLSLLFLVALAPWSRAALTTFWPLNPFPAAPWSYAATNLDTFAFLIPPSQTILSRSLVITNFINPTNLPGPGATVVYVDPSVAITSELSVDGGATWLPSLGPAGTLQLSLRQTSAVGPSRFFETEILALDIAVTSSAGSAQVRERPTQRSLGQTVVTATNGGYLISSYVDLYLDITLDQGANWLPAQSSTHVELGGPPGVASVVSISRPSGLNTTLCWTTQMGATYQLQRKAFVDGTNWLNVGTSVPGTGGQVCAPDGTGGTTNEFYRVLVGP